MRGLLISLILILLFLPAGGQEQDPFRIIEELIEELAAVDEFDTDLESVYDELLNLLRYPVDLNSAGEEELRRLFFINELQMANLLRYRRERGRLASLFELQYIEGFSYDEIRKILPFVTVEEAMPVISLSPSAALRHGRHQLFVRAQQVLQQQRGYAPATEEELAAAPNSRYLGSPLKAYTRYRFNYRNQVQAGFVAEKDAGEEFLRGSNPYGFDYHTFHLQLNDLGRVKTITLGDYQASFGQGLVLWSGLAFGKSSNTLAIRKSPRGLQSYSSTDENMFFRGGGITLRLGEGAEGTLFASRKKIDASVSAIDEDGGILEVSALQNSGLHATPSQMAGKNILGETIMGGNLNYNHRLFRVGATVMGLEYDAVLNPPVRHYNQFDFRGSSNMTGGIDYQFSAGPVMFFGEGAMSSSGGKAFLAGATSTPAPRLSLSLLYRRYDRNYHAYFSNGFRENTRTANERGLYAGVVIHPYRRWKVSAYTDIFSFPWARYTAHAPSSGVEYFVQADFSHSRSLHMYWSFRHKFKPVNFPAGHHETRVLEDAGITRLRYHIGYFVSSTLELRNRAEMSLYRRESRSPERGYLLYQDVLYRPAGIPLSFAFRYGLFSTDSYDARIFAYENDVLYAFSIPAYYDKGFRTYLMTRYSAGPRTDLWIRYALTMLPERETIGTGLNEINGNRRSELKVQVRIRW
ncbi:MAG: helix-hairpin-helix domain-containing protein [Marinilabiliales bacterium]|nr:MAG: helix-hairpin-helix domain-containing protein [Marinilabiliales bacterium]